MTFRASIPPPTRKQRAYSATRFGRADAYRIPDDGLLRTVNLSGGRSSAYMLFNLLRAHDGVLPPTTRVTFCNTGKELAETLVFVHGLELAWRVPIVWLEFRYNPEAKGGARDPKRTYRIVDFQTASRRGEPFDDLIRTRKMLPNVATRACTAELKVATVDRYARHHLKWPRRRIRNIIGFRYDEPERWGEAMIDNCRLEFPMVHARVSRQDVDDFWNGHRLDLEIPSSRSNCDLCFLKGKNTLTQTIRERPALADWWIAKERQVSGYRHLRKPEVARFNKSWTYAQLRRNALSQQELELDTRPDAAVACFCTD